MQPAPPELVLSNWNVTVCILVLIAIAFGTFLAWKQRGLLERFPLVTLVVRESAWLSIPVVVAFTFAGISLQDWPSFAGTPSFDRSSPAPPKPSVGAAAAKPGSSKIQTVSTDKPINRPAWVSRERVTEGIIERVVLMSGQYATAAEAEAELMPKAAELVHQDLQQVNSLGSWDGSWHPTDQDVRRFAVKQQYVEVTEVDFVTFQHPMYRVWWQIELSPAVRAEFLPTWRRQVVAMRILWVGIVAASLALMATLLRLGCRVRILTRRKVVGV